MKILEAQSATLTNYEVYTHLLDQRARYEAQGKKRRGIPFLRLFLLDSSTLCTRKSGHQIVANSTKVLEISKPSSERYGTISPFDRRN